MTRAHFNAGQQPTPVARPGSSGRRHYTTFNSESKIPDLGERPFVSDPTQRCNGFHLRRTEPNETHRPGIRVAPDVRNVESTRTCEKSPSWSSKINNSKAQGVIDGSAMTESQRRVTKQVDWVDSPPKARPVRQFNKTTTTLDGDLQ